MFVRVLVRTNVRAPSTSAVVWLSLVFIRRTVLPYDVEALVMVQGPFDVRFIVMNRSGPGDIDLSWVSVLTSAMAQPLDPKRRTPQMTTVHQQPMVSKIQGPSRRWPRNAACPDFTYLHVRYMPGKRGPIVVVVVVVVGGGIFFPIFFSNVMLTVTKECQ